MTLDRRSRERLFKLLSALADDELNCLQRDELTSLLSSDPLARRFYIQYAMQQSLVRREAARHVALMEIAVRDEHPVAASRPYLARSRPIWRARRSQSRSGRRRIAGVVAAIAFMVLGLATLHRMFPQVKPVSRLACELVGTRDCLWGRGTHLAIGAQLASGKELQLLSGDAELRFESGVQVMLGGPSRLRIESQSSLFLEVGRVTAVVSDAGRGFSIVTPSMTVVDLGTEFGVRVDSHGAAEVQVFRGTVDAQPGAPLSPANTPLRLFAHQAAVTNVEKGLLAVGPIDVVGSQDFRPRAGERPYAFGAGEGDRANQNETRQPTRQVDVGDEPMGARINASRGRIRPLNSPPASVAEQDLKDDRHAFVFLERSGLVLPEGLPVNLTAAGRFDNVQGQHGTLPKGTRVDCYLIHFCSPAEDAHCSGSVEFSDRVLAVVAGKQFLQATDSLLGSLTTKYVPTGSNRQIEGGDVVELSADRRTLSIDWKIKAGVDQVRVLVASPDQE
jgi:hypothetical protein